MNLLPVGTLPFRPVPVRSGEFLELPAMSSHVRGFENYLLNILGTAIRTEENKMVSCSHVMDAFQGVASPPYALVRSPASQGTVVYWFTRIQKAFRYIDFRHNRVNHGIDISALIAPTQPLWNTTNSLPPITWGDSTQVGVGDSVMIAGYPHGTGLFKAIKTNRGIIQPSFYSGIVSAVLPATNENESRLFQLGIQSYGGLSGGAMFNPQTGEILGMITEGLDSPNGESLPVTYAIPSEVIKPYIESISFQVG